MQTPPFRKGRLGEIYFAWARFACICAIRMPKSPLTPLYKRGEFHNLSYPKQKRDATECALIQALAFYAFRASKTINLYPKKFQTIEIAVAATAATIAHWSALSPAGGAANLNMPDAIPTLIRNPQKLIIKNCKNSFPARSVVVRLKVQNLFQKKLLIVAATKESALKKE